MNLGWRHVPGEGGGIVVAAGRVLAPLATGVWTIVVAIIIPLNEGQRNCEYVSIISGFVIKWKTYQEMETVQTYLQYIDAIRN